MLNLLRNTGIVVATTLISLALIYFSIPMSNMAQSRFDVILVLGTPANLDGTVSPVARSRVLEAIRQYRAGIAPRLLMTGGAAHNRFVEADVMARFAESQGVPASAVFTERQSLNTVQNAYYSCKVMMAHDWQSVLVVSSPPHLRRASLIFRYYPIAWKMQAAPWPHDASLWLRTKNWVAEMLFTTYIRIFGFPDAERKFLPKTRFTLAG